MEKKIKIWNFKNIECLIKLKNISESLDRFYYIHNCFLYDNNKSYIITAGCNYYCITDTIKIFDLEGNKINEIENEEKTYFIESYYDNKSSKIYILTCHEGFIISYDYKNKKINKLNSKDKIIFHGIIIKSEGEIVKLISKTTISIIIWNFFSKEILNIIPIYQHRISSFCLWNNNCLCIGCYDGTLLLLDLKVNKIIKEKKIEGNELVNIQKLIHPKFNEYLLSQPKASNLIYLVNIKNKSDKCGI